MADKKISQLTAASLPLAGTEVLPVVQSSATVKVAVDDLTVKNVRSNATTGILQVAGPTAAATRVMTVPDANFTVARTDAANSFTCNQTLSTGNLVIGTAGKGIDFSANAAAPGMTSELLDDYEQGTWTPSDGSGAGLTLGAVKGTYTKIGNMIRVTGEAVYPANADASATLISGLPFVTSGNAAIALLNSGGVAGDAASIANGTSNVYFYTTSLTRKTNANYSGVLVIFSGVYYV